MVLEETRRDTDDLRVKEDQGGLPSYGSRRNEARFTTLWNGNKRWDRIKEETASNCS